MSGLKQLLKIQLLSLFGINKTIHSNNQKEKRKLTGLGILMIFVIAMLAFYSFLYSTIMADSLAQVDAMDTLLSMMMAVTCLITLFTTIYKTNGLLFVFKDYDTLMSLPIKTSTIVTSRIIMLYAMNFGFGLLVMVPAAVVYCLRISPSFVFYPIFIVTLLLIPLVPMIIATILGALISVFSAHFKYKNAVTITISLIFMIGVFAVSFNMNSVIVDFANISNMIMGSINRIYPLAMMYAQAVCAYNMLSLLLFALISVGLFAAFIAVVGKNYKALSTALNTTKSSSNYKMKGLKQSSPFRALYRKEIKRYFSSSLYFLNTAVGVVLLTVMSIALLLFGTQQLATIMEIPQFTLLIQQIAPLAIALFVGMTCTTACSISLEGHSLWILKSMPIPTKSIFLSKIAVNLTILLPAIVLNGVLLCLLLETSIVSTIMMFILPIAYAFFISFLGMVLNLNFVNFEWTSEVAVVKQSPATLISMMVGMAVSIIPIVVVLNITSIDTNMIMLLITLVVGSIDIALYRHIITKGVQKFKAF